MDTLFDWQKFWTDWRNKPAETEYDLYFQVAKTVNGQAMDRSIFDNINRKIIRALELKDTDTLFELCCGNGLCTFELAKHTKEVIGIDFSPHLISDAKRFKYAPNIRYIQSDVVAFLSQFTSNTPLETVKCLMNDSLAYFVPHQLYDILSSLKELSNNNFRMLIRGVPNDDLKWNYYNTESRIERYKQLVLKGDVTNDGIGRWWLPSEISDVCNALGLSYDICNQDVSITNYRMDVMIAGNNKINLHAIYTCE
jgi:hypothetical protein